MAVSRHELAGALAGAAAAKGRDSGNSVMSHLSLEYRVTRLVFDTGQPYEKFRGRYEAAVPPADPRPGDRPGRHARWQDGAADAVIWVRMKPGWMVLTRIPAGPSSMAAT